MLASLTALAAAEAATSTGPNLWGALGCSVAFAAALLATLEAFSDYADAHFAGADTGRVVSHRLRYSGKVGAALITAVSAGVVLALDDNWFALTPLIVIFAAVTVWSFLALRREITRFHSNETARHSATE
jgi:4-hydroxybenzoate polyprenyltransferase